MNRLLSKKRSSSSLHSKNSETSEGTFREGKNPVARSLLYEKTLANAGIHMDDGGEAITDACTCRSRCYVAVLPVKVYPFSSRRVT